MIFCKRELPYRLAKKIQNFRRKAARFKTLRIPPHQLWREVLFIFLKLFDGKNQRVDRLLLKENTGTVGAKVSFSGNVASDTLKNAALAKRNDWTSTCLRFNWR